VYRQPLPSIKQFDQQFRVRPKGFNVSGTKPFLGLVLHFVNKQTAVRKGAQPYASASTAAGR
jgi:hypothetical protein